MMSGAGVIVLGLVIAAGVVGTALAIAFAVASFLKHPSRDWIGPAFVVVGIPAIALPITGVILYFFFPRFFPPARGR